MKHLLLIVAALAACRATSRDETWQSEHSTTPPNSFKLESEAKPAEASAPAGTDGAAARQDEQVRPPATEDQQFIVDAIQGGMFEIESSRIALEKNVSDALREFAHLMVDDHGRANHALMEIVQRRNGRAPTEMSREQKLEIDELQGLTGEAFDRRYYLSQISAHDAAIALFERAVERCQDSDLRDFAERTLPKLREHRRWLEQHPV